MFDAVLDNINWIADPVKPVVKVEETKKEPFFQRSPMVKASRALDGMTPYQIELFNFDELSFPHVNKYIAGLPDYLTKYFVKRYIRTFKAKSRRDANLWIREVMDNGILARVEGVMNRYPISKIINKADGTIYTFNQFEGGKLKRKTVGLDEFSINDVENFSKSIAADIEELIMQFEDKYIKTEVQNARTEEEIDRIFTALYQKMAYYTQLKGVTPPFYHQFKEGLLDENRMNIAMEKMRCEKWWFRQLSTIRSRIREHLNIAVGAVQKKASPYASREAIAEWRLQKRKNTQYIKQMALVNEDDDEEIIGLDEMFYKTVSNPAVRRAELMVRMRGFEEVAKHLNYAGEFYTLTAPSSYHAVHSHGGFVKNWNFSSPADTQKYLCSVFAKIRASLKRQGINPFGFRVVEPHHDGTPHWHLLLFVEQDKVNAMRATFKRYALEEDGDEKGADEHRFTAKAIDWEKGSATGYIAKYIAKNIDGYACDEDVDLETGEKLKDMSRNVSAWARKWRIRQFQQIGGSPVTVWRELRRKRGGEVVGDEQLTKLVEAADRGDWAKYTLLQGAGMPTVKRDDLLARTCYENRKPNQYGEVSKKIIGFFNQKAIEFKTILTRTTVWKLIKKAVVEGALKNSGRRPPWSSVNNCTEREISADEFSPDYQQSQLEKGELLTAIAKRKTWLEKNNIVLTPQDQMILLIGGKVRLKTNELLMFKNGALIKTGVTKWGA
ncbi:replication protein [Pasteurella multocida subsp. multocida]|nr:replication endonuclease [Pasteurella multocida]OIQ13328.1 replication protein [Pasteurella multocida subsp. multocida]PNW19763.1 replication protein [Pasteurella multocida subsp. multocida]HEH9651816.1 replication endonuclease [Pasteurella multocida]HEH9676945.1 replication endonuclease [Pasteurella multocida]HEH9690289.1 replication endonuclease [Pasteurella multocida]